MPQLGSSGSCGGFGGAIPRFYPDAPIASPDGEEPVREHVDNTRNL